MADKVVLDGELSLNIPLDGEAGTVIKVGHDTGIDTIVFNADYTLTFNMTNGETFTTGSIRGEQGQTGAKGDKGDAGDDYILTQQDKEDIANLIEKPWELIEDFTLEEESGFDKSAEPDGTPYNFRSAYIRITVPPNSTIMSSGYGRWYFVDENGISITAETGRYNNNVNQRCKTILIERNANMAFANYNSYTATGDRGMWGYKNITGISFNFGNIRRIYTNTQDNEPAGARIEIYAQRA